MRLESAQLEFCSSSYDIFYKTTVSSKIAAVGDFNVTKQVVNCNKTSNTM